MTTQYRVSVISPYDLAIPDLNLPLDRREELGDGAVRFSYWPLGEDLVKKARKALTALGLIWSELAISS